MTQSIFALLFIRTLTGNTSYTLLPTRRVV